MGYAYAQSPQLCLTLCNPMDLSPPGSSLHGIFLVRRLEWVVISFSRGSSQPRDRTQVSCLSCTAGRIFTTEPQNKPGCLGQHFPEYIYSLALFRNAHLATIWSLAVSVSVLNPLTSPTMQGILLCIEIGCSDIDSYVVTWSFNFQEFANRFLKRVIVLKNKPYAHN